MNQHRFPVVPRSLSAFPSRRDILRGLAGAGLGLGFLYRHESTGAKKKRKHKQKNKKAKPNAFGCLDVGKPCGGNDAKCCSGICEGKKPKKGKRDSSRCVAHDAGICTPGSDVCKLEGVAECHPSNSSCHCVRTTGNATFCGDTGGTGDGPASLCRVCHQDTDCQDEFGPGAACVVYEGLCSDYCAETGYTACVPPCA
jgi:hypothetical protein